MDAGLMGSFLLTRGKHKKIVHQEAHGNKENDVEEPCIEDVERLQKCAGNARRSISEKSDCLQARGHWRAQLMYNARSEALSKQAD